MLKLRLLAPALALSLLAACGGGGDSDSDSDTPSGMGTTATSATAFPTSSDPSGPIPTEALRDINIVLAGGDLHAGGDSNFVFGVTDEQDRPQSGVKATVTFFDLSDRANPKPVGTFEAVESAPGVGEIVEHIHGNGEVHLHGGQDEDRVVYYVPVQFPKAGSWGVVLDAELKDGTKGQSDAGFLVGEQARFPAPGEPAIASDNLTKNDVANIKEIDSGDPPNDMHDIKIKDAIAAGRPVVVVFSTPAFCTSRFCGPVNEEVEFMHDKFKDKVDFVHIEIWRNFETKEMNPTTREWLLQPDGGLSEPWVYVIGKDGVIYDRWEGAVSRNIMEPAIEAVAAGETFADREPAKVLE